MDDFWQLMEEQGEDNLRDSTFYHETFRKSWKSDLRQIDSSSENFVHYGPNEKKYLCDSLDPILKAMNKCANRSSEYIKEFQRQIPLNMRKIQLSKEPNNYLWYNKTIQGIHLRPGLMSDSNIIPPPVEMEGEDSHAVVAGTTGSGKSVFLNNLILNLMIEYPPWELEIYLADLKKVEFSKYMGNHRPPHVRVCAATSEVDYVQSLIKFIKERKDDREKLFARLGVKKISEFREKYPNVIMPRIILIVDEFQQLFLDAEPAQKMVIEDLITNIARKGRSAGVHLLFASQEMQGALSKNQMANFNLRFALHCDSAVSGDILGDSAAKDLKLGQVIVKSAKQRQMYLVPLPEDDPEEDINKDEEEYFDRLLREFSDAAGKFPGYEYETVQKNYDEDNQKDMKDLSYLLSNTKIRNIRMFKNNDDEQKKKFMSLILGRKVVYSPQSYDIENIYISYSKDHCLLCISENTEDLAYFQKLIAENIHYMSVKEDHADTVNRPFYTPYFYDFNQQISAIYTPQEKLKDFELVCPDCEYSDAEWANAEDEFFYYQIDDFIELENEYDYRKQVLRLLRRPDLQNIQDVLREFLIIKYKEQNITDKEQINNAINDSKFLNISDEKILSLLEHEDFSYLGSWDTYVMDLMLFYYRYRIAKIRPAYKIFKPSPVFITGIENIEKLPNWFNEFCSNCMDFNFMTFFFSTTNVQYSVKHASNYIFVAGSDPKLYDDYIGKKPSKGENGLKFRCWVRNTNQRFGFKKYRWESNKEIPSSIDFDSVLGNIFR